MAGKAEQVATVVHEFMHIHAANDRGGAFLGTDEIDSQDAKQPCKDDPRQHVAQRKGKRPAAGTNTAVVISKAP